MFHAYYHNFSSESIGEVKKELEFQRMLKFA